MLYKEIICPVCNGHGFISGSDECSIWAEPCTNCQNGMIVVPVTNGDLMRSCSNDRLLSVLTNLTHTAIYSGGEHNRLLLSTPEDFLFWLNKATDDLDLKTIFDFVNPEDYTHPWTKVVTHVWNNEVDVDAFIECLDCVDSIKVNGAYYIEVQLLKEFIQRFPKEKVNSEYTEYNT